MRISFALGEFAGLFIGRKKATNSVPTPVNPLPRMSRTENAMVEMRAQFRSRNRPMLVETPQRARRTYMSTARDSVAFRDTGEPGILSMLEPCERIMNPVKAPMHRQSTDPISEMTPISVTPIERCKTDLQRLAHSTSRIGG